MTAPNGPLGRAVLGIGILGAMAVLLPRPALPETDPTLRPREAVMDARPVGLDQLAAGDSFTVTLQGEALPSYPPGRLALYSEAHYGECRGGDWASWSTLVHTEAPLTILSPKGTLTLRPEQLRLHLKASYCRVYAASDAASAPEAVQWTLASVSAPVTVATYELIAGRPYHAQVERLSYWLPPMAGSTKPLRRHALILRLSDEPFVDGRPPSLMTPRSLSLSF